jgi:hypothetical protein
MVWQYANKKSIEIYLSGLSDMPEVAQTIGGIVSCQDYVLESPKWMHD